MTVMAPATAQAAVPAVNRKPSTIATGQAQEAQAPETAAGAPCPALQRSGVFAGEPPTASGSASKRSD